MIGDTKARDAIQEYTWEEDEAEVEQKLFKAGTNL